MYQLSLDDCSQTPYNRFKIVIGKVYRYTQITIKYIRENQKVFGPVFKVTSPHDNDYDDNNKNDRRNFKTARYH